MRKFKTAEPKNLQRINEQIRISPVRVIAEDGTQLGIMASEEALQRARKVELDLVEVAPQESPPVCRIMDYGKYKYQQKKRQHRSHTHQTKMKEIRVRPKTGDHDINVKLKRPRDFLAHGDKLTVTVISRGRERPTSRRGPVCSTGSSNSWATSARWSRPPANSADE